MMASRQVASDLDLLERILQHADQQDLLACIRVSRLFWDVAGPLLYRRIKVERTDKHPFHPFSTAPKKDLSLFGRLRRSLSSNKNGDLQRCSDRLRTLVAHTEELIIVANYYTMEDKIIWTLQIDPRAVPLLSRITVEVDLTTHYTAAAHLISMASKWPMKHVSFRQPYTWRPMAGHTHGMSVDFYDRETLIRLCSWTFGINTGVGFMLRSFLNASRGVKRLTVILTDQPGLAHDIIMEELPPVAPRNRFRGYLQLLNDFAVQNPGVTVFLVNFGGFKFGGPGWAPTSGVQDWNEHLQWCYEERARCQERLERETIPALGRGTIGTPLRLMTMEEYIEGMDGLKRLSADEVPPWQEWMTIRKTV